MNIVDRYINSSMWFNVIRVINLKRQKINDPFTKCLNNYMQSNHISIDIDCTNIDKNVLTHNIKPDYRKLYFKFNIDGVMCSVLIFNANVIYSFFRNNVFTIELTAEDVVLNNTEV